VAGVHVEGGRLAEELEIRLHARPRREERRRARLGDVVPADTPARLAPEDPRGAVLTEGGEDVRELERALGRPLVQLEGPRERDRGVLLPAVPQEQLSRARRLSLTEPRLGAVAAELPG